MPSIRCTGFGTGTDKSAEEHGDEPRPQMTLTIATDDGTGMVFVEMSANFHSRAPVPATGHKLFKSLNIDIFLGITLKGPNLGPNILRAFLPAWTPV